MAQAPLSDALAQQAIDLTAAHGSVSAGSRALGISLATFRGRYAVGLQRGFTPHVQPLLAGEKASAPEGMGLKKVSTQFDEAGNPEKQWVGNARMSEKVRDTEDPPKLLDGMLLKGVSTLYDGDGRKTAEWVLQRTDAERQEEKLRGVLAALCEKIEPLPPIVGPSTSDADLLNLYTLTDCHVGALAWARETGEPWDLKIAEQCLVDTFVQMIDAAPAAKIGIVNQLGDFLHQDSLMPMTPTSHHILDADSRYQKMVEVAVRILRRIVERALAKHERVRVLMCEGNHDISGSVWLRVLFAQLYADNPRVEIEMSPNPYVAYLHGQTLLGFHHGHMTKHGNLPQVFAQKFRKEWGQSTHTYIHSGHKHHVDEKEYPGVIWVQHPTLAAPDAYAARGGWLSKRQATSMTYHTIRGESARGVFVPL
jgi:hypothetical protein